MLISHDHLSRPSATVGIKRTKPAPEVSCGTDERVSAAPTDPIATGKWPPRSAVAMSPDLAPSIIVNEEELSRFQALAPAGVGLFGIRAIDEDAVHLVDTMGNEIRQTSAPMLCLGFVVVQGGDGLKLDQARRMFEVWSGCDLPEPSQLPSDRSADRLAMLLSTSLVGRLQSYAEHITRLSRELVRLRVAHEDMMNAFSKVESFIGEANVQPCRVVFEDGPVGGEFIRGATAISQILPTSTLGLSAIEIHLGDLDARDVPAGGMTLELRSLEDHETHEIWHLHAEELEAGWLTLMLKGGLAGTQRTPELIIRPLARLGVLPDLSLGALQPLSSFQAQATNDRTSTPLLRSLAVRLWKGIPGVRPPALAGKTLYHHASPDVRVVDIAVPFTFLQNAKMRSTHWQPEFSPVTFRPEFRMLEVHPPPVGTMWAEIEKFPVRSSPARLTIRYLVRNPDAEPVEFAMGFASDPSESCGNLLREGWDAADQDGLVFSGWHRATFKDPGLLQLQLTNSGETGSLFLGTRMADGRVNAFAWACFQDLRITLLRDTPIISTPPASWPKDIITSGTAEPVILTEGIPLPVATLMAVEDAHPRGKDDPMLVKYDQDRRGLFCHPPLKGMTLARLRHLPGSGLSGLLARLHVANSLSAGVEFGIALTTLPADEVMKRLDAGDHQGSDCFVFSGWQCVTYEQDLLAGLRTAPMSGQDMSAFFVTRMNSAAETNDFAWAYFTDIRVISDRPGAATSAAHLT